MTEPLSADLTDPEREALGSIPWSTLTARVGVVERILADRLAARDVAHRAEVEAARAETRALREAVEALADEIDAHDYTPGCMDGGHPCRECTTAEAVRAALAQHAEPDTTPRVDQ